MPKLWFKWLSFVEWWYNASYHSAIKMTPYKALYRKDPPRLNYHQKQRSKVGSVDEFVKKRAELQVLLKKNLLLSQERMKFYVDRKISEKEFQESDEVFLKLQPYKQNSIRETRDHKFVALRITYFFKDS